MITDDELIRLLELADPARVDDPDPRAGPGRVPRCPATPGRTTVTLIDLEPTPVQAEQRSPVADHHRRRGGRADARRHADACRPRRR